MFTKPEKKETTPNHFIPVNTLRVIGYDIDFYYFPCNYNLDSKLFCFPGSFQVKIL